MNIQFIKKISDAFEYAAVSFTAKSEPHSDLFDDVYFSDCGGLAETEHVFINGNQLIDKLQRTSKSEFIIGETGFGTGLNLLTLIHLYQKLSSNTTSILPHISFLTVEKYPMQAEDMLKAHSLFPELNKESQELLAQYKNLKAGLNILQLNSSFTLYLLVGDIEECFQAINACETDKVDAWFLDGFAPSQNTAMWSLETAKLLARLSHKNTSLATFTVAGFVKRNLIEAGFVLTKVPGFGRKREMLTGICSNKASLV